MNPITEAARNVLRAEYKAASDALNAIPGLSSGPMGLTPDSVRSSPEYRAARAASDRAFQALRRFNAANPPPRGPRRLLRPTP